VTVSASPSINVLHLEIAYSYLETMEVAWLFLVHQTKKSLALHLFSPILYRVVILSRVQPEKTETLRSSRFLCFYAREIAYILYS